MKKSLLWVVIIYALISCIVWVKKFALTYEIERYFYGSNTGTLLWIAVLILITWTICIKQVRKSYINPQAYNASKMFLLYTIAFIDGIVNLYFYSSPGGMNGIGGMFPIIPGILTIGIIFLISTFSATKEVAVKPLS